MLSERERQALEEIEREVSAEDPRLAASLQATAGRSAAWSGRWPYTVAVVAAWVLVAACLLLGLPVALLGATALAVVAVGVRRWRFRDRGDGRERSAGGSDGDGPPQRGSV